MWFYSKHHQKNELSYKSEIMYRVVIYFFIVTLTVKIECAKILAVFPTPSISHQVVFRPLTQELVRRGHEVVVITTDPAFPKGKAPVNLTEIDVHDISYSQWYRFIETASGTTNNLIKQMTAVYPVLSNIFEEQIHLKDIQTILRDENEKFDLLLLEEVVRPALVLSHVFKVPVITISSVGGALFNNMNIVGAHSNFFLYPTVFRRKFCELTMWEKIKEFYVATMINYEYDSNEQIENEMLKRNFGNGVPTLSELKNNIDMMFVNTYSIWDNNRPIPPNLIYIGGVLKKPQKDLPMDLKNYLDSSVSGVIYVSFGTNVNLQLLPKSQIATMAEVLSQLSYDVLWKWDDDEPPFKSKNIKTSKWLPQSDLLMHPKVKLFITQGGFQSTDEAIMGGVPLIGVPLLGDQWFNVENYVRLKIGLKLDMQSFTNEQFRNAVNTVIENPSYHQNVKKLARQIHDQPQSALERAVWWTEYVLRHGGARHLRAPAANMGWWQYLEMELVLLALAFILTLGTIVAIAAYYLLVSLFKSDKKLKAN